jgi:hypothetical protein
MEREPMIVTGAQIVAIAKKDVGQREIPLGSNTGPFVVQAQRATFLGGTGWPWCAAEVCYIAKRAGVPLAYNGAGAHDIADHHKPWINPAVAKPGMILDLNEGSGHTCTIVAVHIDSGTFTTVDGNWGDEVSLVTTHRVSEVRAIWRIPGVSYGSTPPAPAVKPKRLPPFVVTTSASGHRKVVFTTSKKRNLVRWLTTHQLSKLFPNGLTISRGRAR